MLTVNMIASIMNGNKAEARRIFENIRVKDDCVKYKQRKPETIHVKNYNFKVK